MMRRSLALFCAAALLWPTLALAETVTDPETVTPLAGAVIETVGGVISGAALDVVTCTTALVVGLPAKSRARAASVCEPFAAVELFQEIE